LSNMSFSSARNRSMVIDDECNDGGGVMGGTNRDGISRAVTL